MGVRVENSEFELPNDCSNKEYEGIIGSVSPMASVISKYLPDADPKDVLLFKEFVLWGLAENDKLSRNKYSKGVSFADGILNSLYER